MMALLRSRKLMFILAAVVTVALVVSGAIGLFNAMGTSSAQMDRPESGADGRAPAAERVEDMVPSPEMAELGAAPDGFTYSDLGEYCESGHCGRLVAVTSEEAGAEESVEAVYTHLLDQGYERQPPPGADDAALTENTLIGDSLQVADATSPARSDSMGVLLLLRAEDEDTDR